MKKFKFIIPLFVIITTVVVVGLSAFKKENNVKPAKTTDLYVFEYHGNYTTGSVETLSNWTYVGKNAALCNDIDEKACKVAVTEEYIDDPLNPSSLQNVTITASTGSGTQYVTAISDPGDGNVFSNQND